MNVRQLVYGIFNYFKELILLILFSGALILGSVLFVIGVTTGDLSLLVIGVAIWIGIFSILLMLVLGFARTERKKTLTDIGTFCSEVNSSIKRTLTQNRRFQIYSVIFLLSIVAILGTQFFLGQGELGDFAVLFRLLGIMAVGSSIFSGLIMFTLVLKGSDEPEPRVTSTFEPSYQTSTHEIEQLFYEKLDALVVQGDPTYEEAIQTYHQGHRVYSVLLFIPSLVVGIIHHFMSVSELPSLDQLATFNLVTQEIIMGGEMLFFILGWYLAAANHERHLKNIKQRLNSLCSAFHQRLRDLGLTFKTEKFEQYQGHPTNRPGRGITFTSNPTTTTQRELVDFIELSKRIIVQYRGYRNRISDLLYLLGILVVGWLGLTFLDDGLLEHSGAMLIFLVAWTWVVVFKILGPTVRQQQAIEAAKLVIGTYVNLNGSFSGWYRSKTGEF